MIPTGKSVSPQQKWTSERDLEHRHPENQPAEIEIRDYPQSLPLS
jgi:hypothetical protein